MDLLGHGFGKYPSGPDGMGLGIGGNDPLGENVPLGGVVGNVPRGIVYCGTITDERGKIISKRASMAEILASYWAFLRASIHHMSKTARTVVIRMASRIVNLNTADLLGLAR